MRCFCHTISISLQNMSNKRARYELEDGRNAQASSSRRLDDEEAELEAELFGKKRVIGGSGAGVQNGLLGTQSDDGSQASDDEMAGMDDQDVSAK